ncbi:hypothetical protein D0Z62_02475 [Providencia rettgeri]|nr:hypothetical protein D0Z62_02475 [Providencia rettgeri]
MAKFDITSLEKGVSSDIIKFLIKINFINVEQFLDVNYQQNQKLIIFWIPRLTLYIPVFIC